MPLKKSILKNEFNKEWKSLGKSFSDFCGSSKLEPIHELRIHIKKIRTLLVFSEKNKTELKDSLLPIKSLFKEGGEIRSLLIHLTILKKHQLHAASIEKQIQTNLAQKTRILLLHQPRYTKQLSQIRKRIEPHLKTVKEKKLRAFFADTVHNLSVLYQKPFDHPAEIHCSRKELKRLCYLNDLLKKHSKHKTSLNEAYISHLQSEIGNWHDIHETYLYLKKYEKGNTNSKKLAQISRNLMLRIKKETSGFGEKALIKGA